MLFFNVQSYSQIISKVDERFELTSIMFALAGVPEYCECAIPSYVEDIITELAPYEFTEPINYIRELNIMHAIGYNNVSTTAEMLEIKNGKIRLQPQFDISQISKYDSQWNEELFAKYLKMINQFYKESNFHKFYKDHKELYDIATNRMNELLATIDTQWFYSFFGKEFDKELDIYISITNGPSNYALRNGILVGVMKDENGMPHVNSFLTLPTIIHEFCHHYTNPLFDRWSPQMEYSANKIYPYVEDKMHQLAYSGADVTLEEWLNNLCVLAYLKETGYSSFNARVSYQVARGFIWMRRSMDFMENFYAHRDLYPHIEDFMPQLIAFLNFTADNFDSVLTEYKNRHPYITNVYPAVNSDITGFNEIIITFSEPMLGAWGFYGSGSDDPNVKELYINAVEWSEDKLQVKLILAPEESEPNCTYGIQLLPEGFISAKYFHLDNTCRNLIFNTIQK